MKRQNSLLKRTQALIAGNGASKQHFKKHFGTPLYRNAYFLMANNVAQGVFGFAFWIAATRFYSEESVGLASGAIAAMMLLAMVSSLGLDYALIKFLPSSGEKSSAMVNSCLIVGGLMSVAVAMVFLAGLSIWSPDLVFLREDPVFLFAFVVFTPASTIFMMLTQVFVAERRTDFSLWRTIIASVMRLSLLIVLAAFFGTFGVFASWGLSFLIASVIGIILFLPRAQSGYRPVPAIETSVLRKMVTFSLSNYLSLLLLNIPNFVLPLVVLHRLGAADNAYFYISWQLAAVLSAVPVSVSLSLYAEGAYDEANLSQHIRRSLKLLSLSLIPVILVTTIFADKILLTFGENYADNAANVVRILAAATLPLSLNHIYFSMERVKMKMKTMNGLVALISISTFALTYVLIPHIGITGPAVAWAASQGAVCLITLPKLWHMARFAQKLGQP